MSGSPGTLALTEGTAWRTSTRSQKATARLPRVGVVFSATRQRASVPSHFAAIVGSKREPSAMRAASSSRWNATSSKALKALRARQLTRRRSCSRNFL